MVAIFCDRYHWPHDWWRAMGWKEFHKHLGALANLIARENNAVKTDPDSWAGREHDPFWLEQEKKRNEMRGRG